MEPARAATTPRRESPPRSGCCAPGAAIFGWRKRSWLWVKREYDSHSRPLILYYRGYASSRVADVDRRKLRPPAEAEGPRTLPAGAHAGAAVSLQPGVRRLREDPVSRPYSEAPTDARRVFPRGGRVRRADGGHPGRGTAAAPADRRDRPRPGGPQEVHLPVHQRAAAEAETPPVPAEQVPYLFGPHGWREGASQIGRAHV